MDGEILNIVSGDRITLIPSVANSQLTISANSQVVDDLTASTTTAPSGRAVSNAITNAITNITNNSTEIVTNLTTLIHSKVVDTLINNESDKAPSVRAVNSKITNISTTQPLGTGDYNTAAFWRNNTVNGEYYYSTTMGGSNAPSEYGLITVVRTSNNDVQIEWKQLPDGQVWRTSCNNTSTNLEWKRYFQLGVHTKADIGLDNVDNTSDENKPVSTATRIAIDAKVVDTLVGNETDKAPSVKSIVDAVTYNATTQTIPAGDYNTAAFWRSLPTTNAVYWHPTGVGTNALCDLAIINVMRSDNDVQVEWKQQPDGEIWRASCNSEATDMVWKRYFQLGVHTKADIGLDNVDNTSDENKPVSTATQNALNTKVDKVAGKQLSTEDYSTAEKTKLADIEAGAEVNQNAYSILKFNTTTIASTGKLDTFNFASGENILFNIDETTKTVSLAADTNSILAGALTGIKVDGVTLI